MNTAREPHRCQALCTAGICEIDTTPQSIEATFTGCHETFQYNTSCAAIYMLTDVLRSTLKVCVYSSAETHTQAVIVSKRLPCVKPIPPGERELIFTALTQRLSTSVKIGNYHTPDFLSDPAQSHRCDNCGYFCTLPQGKGIIWK